MGLELVYRADSMPRLANWQHFGHGAYVTALEPFSGSLFGKDRDKHPLAAQWLEPGQQKHYELTIKLHTDPAAIEQLLSHGGKLTRDTKG